MSPTLQVLPDMTRLVMGYLTLIGVSSVRLFVIMTIFPPSADGVLQGPVRNAIVLLFSTFVAYGQPLAFAEGLHGAALVEIGLREGMIGLVLGFAASSVFWVAECAGYYIDDLTGYNNAQVQNPLRNEQATPTSTLLQQVATVAFWSLGGMTFLLGTLYQSYQWWPLNSPTIDVSNVLEAFAMKETDTLMQQVAKLAAPAVMILLLIDFAFAFAAKSASKLELMGLSQPVKGAVAVLLLALFVGVFVDQVRDQLTLTAFTSQFQAWADAARDGTAHAK
ncbi:type III secretion system export apparatus subunit SctT [Burkholderia plantarii]|uniref:type III secretion system export apparatus subunit SctT n=1 Tax=Burkholderia plantarii TaxID=41899 RepID=UPI0018DE7462|nr:type III secretion system export apparatus subunit SctT [Burkholderia plantarii]